MGQTIKCPKCNQHGFHDDSFECVGCGYEPLEYETLLRTRLAALEGLAAFFRSVIKSGEPWTEQCQEEYDAALAGSAQDGEQGEPAFERAGVESWMQVDS